MDSGTLIFSACITFFLTVSLAIGVLKIAWKQGLKLVLMEHEIKELRDRVRQLEIMEEL